MMKSMAWLMALVLCGICLVGVAQAVSDEMSIEEATRFSASDGQSGNGALPAEGSALDLSTDESGPNEAPTAGDLSSRDGWDPTASSALPAATYSPETGRNPY
jgi:hypothetical protein